MTQPTTTTDRTALVTGAARGIGLATTKSFLAAGWRVAMIDRDAPALAEAAGGIGGVRTFTCDVSEPEAVTAMMGEVIDWAGRLDALVNNAGVADFGPIEETDFARWRTVMATNLDGVFLCSQAAIPHLKASRGAIVNIASISGLRASTLRTAYGTSKAAVIHLTQQQAAELGEYGIRANCVALARSARNWRWRYTQDIIDAYHDAIPLNRYGSEEEIAETITFLAMERSSYVTGQCLAADGGFESTGVGLPALRGNRHRG